MFGPGLSVVSGGPSVGRGNVGGGERAAELGERGIGLGAAAGLGEPVRHGVTHGLGQRVDLCQGGVEVSFAELGLGARQDGVSVAAFARRHGADRKLAAQEAQNAAAIVEETLVAGDGQPGAGRLGKALA